MTAENSSNVIKHAIKLFRYAIWLLLPTDVMR